MLCLSGGFCDSKDLTIVIPGSPNDLYGDHTSAAREDSQVEELVGICESLSAITFKLEKHPVNLRKNYSSSGCPGLLSRHMKNSHLWCDDARG